jgi:hypothetical protein
MVTTLARVARPLSVVPKTDSEMSFLPDPAARLRTIRIQQTEQGTECHSREGVWDLRSLAFSGISNTPAACDPCRKMSKLKAISIKLSPASPSYFYFQTTYFLEVFL